MPSISGKLKANGAFSVSGDSTVRIDSGLQVSKASASVESFKPEMLYTAYQDALSGITDIQLGLLAEISENKGVQINVDTDLDSVINNALQAQVSKQVEQFKADIRQEGEAYLTRQKEAYSAEIARFSAVSGKSKTTLADIENYESSLQAKKAEAEKRVETILKEKTASAEKALTDTKLQAQKEADAAKAQADKEAADAKKKAEKAASSKIKKLL